MNAITQAETTALTLPERAAVAIGESANAAKLRELASQSAGILVVTNPDGRTEAHRAGMLLARTRTNITTAGKAAREDATAFSKAVIALEKDLVAIIEPEEKRVLALRDAFDEQLAAEKAAKIAAERARTDVIQARITAVRNLPASTVGKTAVEISQMIYELAGTISEDDAHAATFEEFADEFKATRANVLDALAHVETEQLAIEAAAREAEQERLREAARLEAEKAEMARQRAENERIANEQAVERQRLAALAEAQEKAAAKLREEAAANLKAEQEAQAKVAAETKRQLEAQQAAIAEQSRKLAEQQAAADARDAAALAAAQDAQRREDDHGPALLMNEQFDADRESARLAAEESERHRLQALTEQAESDSHQPASLEDLLDQVDAGEISIADIPVGDDEIIALVMEVFSMERGAAIGRLQAIDFAAARQV